MLRAAAARRTAGLQKFSNFVIFEALKKKVRRPSQASSHGAGGRVGLINSRLPFNSGLLSRRAVATDEISWLSISSCATTGDLMFFRNIFLLSRAVNSRPGSSAASRPELVRPIRKWHGLAVAGPAREQRAFRAEDASTLAEGVRCGSVRVT